MGAFVPVIHASSTARPDEADTLAAAEAVAAALGRLGHDPEVVALDLDFATLETIATRRPLAVFNLVEAVRGDGSLAHLAPALLTHLGLPFTGAGLAATLGTLSKLTTKQMLAANGLPTPPWWPAGVGVPAGERVIVKSVWEHASYGMDTDSVVPGSRARDEVSAREARFGGTFFAERFVPGREFNVALLAGPREVEVLPIQEIRFDDLGSGRLHIVDYEAKWDARSPAYHGTPRRFGLEAREPRLAQRLADLALACWRVFDLAGYARVDVRADASGEPLVLEINTNPCLTPDAGFAATAAAAGLSYETVVSRILDAATAQARATAPCSA